MHPYLIAYLITGAVFLPLDYLWLRYVGQSFYRDRLGDILADEFRLAPGLVFYALYVGGIVFFALQPAFATGSWRTALLHGALFGLVAYATYDLTNHATLRHWSLSVTILDILWGAVVTGATATAAFALTRRLAGS
jgi:uncharacterized membrane protein